MARHNGPRYPRTFTDQPTRAPSSGRATYVHMGEETYLGSMVAGPRNELLEAARSGDVSGMLKLLESPQYRVDMTDDFSCTLLHYAARNSCTDMALLLQKTGANVHARNCKLETPLHCAADTGNVNAVTVLLNAGAEINAKDVIDCTPLHRAVASEFRDVPGTEHFSAAKALVAAGADVNSVFRGGMSCLNHAVSTGDPAMVSLLLSNRADPNIGTDQGSTPLHFAAQDNFLDVVLLLLRGGADIHAKDKKGDQPIHYASDVGHHAMVALLKRHGAVL